MNVNKRFEAWATRAAKHRLSAVWLALISFAEASFFPIPPDIFLMPMVALQKKRWIQLGAITALYSVLGGVAGYLIGYVFYEALAVPLIQWYGLEDQIAQVGTMFEERAFWAVFISAFTPIPYKVFTIASGFFQIDLLILVVGASLGRGLRFMFEAWLMQRYGEGIAHSIFRSLNTFLLITVILVVLAVVWILK